MILLVKGNMMTEISAQPFVKWAGGKRQLLGQIKASLPKHFNGYMEPFVDGGAVYFDLQPEKSIINDINESRMAEKSIIIKSGNSIMIK